MVKQLRRNPLRRESHAPEHKKMTLTEIMKKHGIQAAGIPFGSCRLTRGYKLRRVGFEPRSVYFGLIPYYTRECDLPRSVSAYAVSKDYHLFIEETGALIEKEAKEAFPGAGFAVFGDSSPFDERDGAARAGLGVIGRNGMLITEKYSSYVFIFEIVSDVPPDREPVEPGRCPGCGRCAAACPFGMTGENCLSAITQKKGGLDEKEKETVLRYGSVWGCDICQEVCPYTAAAKKAGTIYTDIPFFTGTALRFPDEKTLADSDDFAQRAYSWRPKDVILRNIRLFEEHGTSPRANPDEGSGGREAPETNT